MIFALEPKYQSRLGPEAVEAFAVKGYLKRQIRGCGMGRAIHNGEQTINKAMTRIDQAPAEPNASEHHPALL